MSRDFIGALLQLNAEKGVPREQLVRTVEDAIQSAYRRVAPGYEDVYVSLEPETGEMRIYRARVVVSEVEDEATEWSIAQAQEHDANAKLGDLVQYEQLEPTHFGRVGAQVAGQVVRQRLREAERETLFDEFAHREGEIITGSVGRVEPSGVILDLGKAEAILRTTDQSATEHYRIGQHVKAYVLEVRRTTRGPLIYVSRTHKSFLRRLFELEVPEIQAGTVEIRAIAREAGSRSKMAVASRQEGLDPVGATVGQRGARVQAVVAELGGEKIDVIPWSDDPEVFVANALSPAQVVAVHIDEEERIASVTVPERMLSLAIGREGQNARLAAKLTGWRIDIRSEAGTVAEVAASPDVLAEADPIEAEPAAAADEPAAGEPDEAAVHEPTTVPDVVAADPTEVQQ
jgi:N utilization substance protein A